MKSIKELRESGLETSPQELRDEIKIRTDLLNQMVGTLYPRILWNEIDQIEAILNETGSGTS